MGAAAWAEDHREGVLVGEGWLLVRAPLRDVYRRSWARVTLSLSSGMLTISFFDHPMDLLPPFATLPLHPACSLSSVSTETAPAVLDYMTPLPFGAPHSLLPQERFFALRIEWPEQHLHDSTRSRRPQAISVPQALRSETEVIVETSHRRIRASLAERARLPWRWL